MIGSVAQFGNSSRRAVAAGQVSPDDDYRRQARRLRRIYAKNPSLMHQRLRQLAESRGAGERPEQPVAKSPSLAANSPAAWYFAHRVAGRLQAGLLSYSDRVALLKEAQGLGIKRFEANLIIAVTQHRMGGVQAVSRAANSEPTKRGWAWAAGVVLGVQAVIVGAAWWLVRG